MADGVREAHRALTDQEVHPMLVSVEEGWDSHDHFKNQDAEGPPVHREVVSVADKHLWCQVLGRSTERVCQLSCLNKLSQAEVSN